MNASASCGPNGKADFDYASAFAGRDIEQIIDGQAVAGPNVNGINDFVSQDVDCEAGVATFARCRCELGFVAPFQVVGFQLLALSLEMFEVSFRCPKRFLLRQ